MISENNIDDAVFEGIRKTISRFRRKPFHYFTEADIHSSLLNDITRAAPDNTIFRPKDKFKDISISLVHQEYPTHFRYKKNTLLDGYKLDSEINKTFLDYRNEHGKSYGDRGNFDLAVLNKDFVLKMLKSSNRNLTNALKEIIHKKNKLALQRLEDDPDSFKKEILYAIEVKFIHIFNSRYINMLYEVIKDDQKLRLASINSGGNIKPINLVFCSSPVMKTRGGITSVIDLIKEYIENGIVEDRKNIVYKHPNEVSTIFIESFIDDDNQKKTVSPLGYFPNDKWSLQLMSMIK